MADGYFVGRIKHVVAVSVVVCSFNMVGFNGVIAVALLCLTIFALRWVRFEVIALYMRHFFYTVFWCRPAERGQFVCGSNSMVLEILLCVLHFALS